MKRISRPLLVLLVLAGLTLFFWRGSNQMITGLDIVLHGGLSFVLVLAGNFVLRKREPRVPPSFVFAAVLLVGISVEIVEFYLDIDFSAGDIVVDALGGLAGWAVFALVAPFLEQGDG